MELVILNRIDFSVKDNVRVANEFEILHDLVVTQRSTFKVDKKELNAKIGDYLYVKKDGLYFGVIESFIDENNYQLISCYDFKEIFKDDKVMTIHEILELITKMYGVSVRSNVVFDNGSFLGLEIRIVQISSGVKIKADNLFLDDLIVNDSSKEQVNKVTYYPRKDNLFFKDIKTYFLLKDGTISEDVSSSLRYEKVISKAQTYNDNDYLDIPDKVKSILVVSKEDHQITFTTTKKNSIEALNELELGDFIEFIYKGKIYDSVVTGLKYINNMEVVHVTLGEYRVNLTEKLQILTKGVTSNVGNVTINNQGYSDLDGGEF